MQVQAAEELPPGLKERIEREFELHRHAFSRELVEHCCPRTVSVRRGDNRERIQEFVDQQVAAAYQDQSLNFQIETDDGVYVVNPQGCSVVCAEEQGRGESEGQRENVSSVSTDDLLGQHEFQSIMARVMSDIKRIQGREQTPSEPRVPELAVRMGDFSRRTPIESYLGGVISYVLYTHHIDLSLIHI